MTRRWTFFLFLVLLISISQQLTENEYYVDLIKNTIEEAKKATWDTDAKSYESNENQLNDFGTYDFIIIGCGSAGSVLANRLSEEKKFNVLVLEAGDLPNNVTGVPDLHFPAEFTHYNWGFVSTPQTTACLGLKDRVCPMPRGRGVGGSTLINYLAYVRGFKTDFDKWAVDVDDDIWSFDNILPYFKKSEDFNIKYKDRIEPAYHGEGGYLHVDYKIPTSPQTEIFLQGNAEIGYKTVDHNANKIGVAQTQINTKEGRRWDGGTAFILPVLSRKNLNLLTNSYVTKLNINKTTKIVENVEFTHRGKKYIANAKREVILSAGAIQSPQVLMLSGVGPQKHLENMNIDLIQNLEVGTSLKDQPTFYGISFGSNYTADNLTLPKAVDDFLHGYGFLTSAGNSDGIGFYPSRYSKSKDIPDIELLLIPANQFNTVLQQKASLFTDETVKAILGNANVLQTFSIVIVALHVKSTGTLRLKSNNPYDYPIIDPRYLSDPENHDINLIYDGIEIILKLAETEAFKSINASLQGSPLKGCQHLLFRSTEYWYCAIRQVTFNIYHPVSSCPMAKSPKEGGVVNSHCKVFGVDNLRVVDTSVFPFTLAGHPNAAVVMVAEVISDKIKEKYLGVN